MHPSQRFVFVPESSGSLLPNEPNNNRADALLRSYSINAQTGALTLAAAFAVGRNIFSLALGPGGRVAYALTPSGAAADPSRGTVRVLAIDPQTGALSDAGAAVVSNSDGRDEVRVAHVTYTYEVAGRVHQGRRIVAGRIGVLFARGALERWRKRDACVVAHDPQPPQVAVLEPGVHAVHLAGPAFGLLFIVLGITWAWLLVARA